MNNRLLATYIIYACFQYAFRLIESDIENRAVINPLGASNRTGGVCLAKLLMQLTRIQFIKAFIDKTIDFSLRTLY